MDRWMFRDAVSTSDFGVGTMYNRNLTCFSGIRMDNPPDYNGDIYAYGFSSYGAEQAMYYGELVY